MRKLLLIAFAAATLAACNEDTAGPADDRSFLLDEAAVLAFGSMDLADPGSHYIARLHRLPDNLKLTADQQAKIKAALEAFAAETKADRDALNAIHREALEARRAGKSPEEVRAVLAKGDAIVKRLHAAEAALRTKIDAILTAEQKAWLASNGPERCRALALTDAQKTQITALITAFEQANKADLELMKKVFEEARAAHQAGATREQVAAILKKASEASARVRAAQIALTAAIQAVLTPEQRASGCFGPRMTVGHHR